MTYKFDPKDWVSDGLRWRLSTSYGKYAKEPYSLTLDKFYKHIRQTCPHSIIFKAPSDLETALNQDWWWSGTVDKICTGYWYTFGLFHTERVFQNLADAIHYKLRYG